MPFFNEPFSCVILNASFITSSDSFFTINDFLTSELK